MSNQDDRNKNKTKLLIITLIAIIIVLFIGVVYQFITIKKLQKQQENNAIVKVVNSKNNFY